MGRDEEFEELLMTVDAQFAGLPVSAICPSIVVCDATRRRQLRSITRATGIGAAGNWA